MTPLDDMELQTTERGGRRRPGYLPLAVAAVALVVLGTGLYFGFCARRATPPPVTTEAEAPAPETAATPEAAAQTPVQLPALDDSDGFVRQLVQRLSADPRVVVWLANEELIRRFTVAVDNIAEGRNPRRHVAFLAPEAGFRTAPAGDLRAIDPASYARYDALTEIFTAIDTQGAVRAYRTLEPLIDQAYRDLGYPTRDFDRALAEAIDVLRSTPVVDREILLVPKVRSFAFVDPELEALAPAQKQLLRMGPENMRKIQRKLAEIEAALDLTFSGR